MSFNFDNFTKKIHKEFEQDFKTEEVKKLLSLDDDYLKDSPVSTGKRLIIDTLKFSGVKPKPLDSKFSFSHKFNEGINLLIASNLKGKSSIFKIIRFALTGNKPENIGKWLEQVLLIFRISDKTYTSYLDLSNGNLKAKLINGFIDDYDTAKTSDSIWETTSNSDFESRIKDFFFNQFSYYPLKWTQKDSRKDVLDLKEAGTTWRTYFHSIYLESKDSTKLSMGAQEVKVFEMLLGLELTYPINRLRIKLDGIESDKSIHELQFKKRNDLRESKIEELQQQITRKQEEYNAIMEKRKGPIKVIDTSHLYTEYDRLTNILNTENRRIHEDQEKLTSLNKKKNSLQKKITNYENSISKLIEEKEHKERKIIELAEYLKTKAFFSNLDIQHCPNCNHEVSEERINLQRKNHKCSLCSEMINVPGIDDSKENITSTINGLKESVALYQAEIDKTQKLLNQKESIFTATENNIKEINLHPIQDLEKIKQDISIVEKTITETQSNVQQPISDNELIELIKEIGGLESQLKSLNLIDENVNTDYVKQIELLKYAIDILKGQRYEEAKDLITKLEVLMLSEVKRFGINNISKITISQNMDIKYTQYEEDKKFDSFVEGEQLRLKIAFYLSLMQLDISENFGRHTRFLIIDSPTKEEADDEYLGGLKTELQTINNKYKNDLQIFIGTANRSFEDQFENQLVINKGEYVF